MWVVVVGVPLLLLGVSFLGMLRFSRGFSLFESVGLLVCGVVAGGALAALAAARQRVR